MKISEKLTLAGATRSNKAAKLGILNIPNVEQIEAIKLVAEKIYDKVKEQFPSCFIGSFFRNETLNRAVGGSKTSQHCKGEAIDIDSKNDNANIFNWIKDNLKFDQLIWEFGNETAPAWVHVSFKKTGNRNQIITIKKNI